jgi:hypothetical protein
VEMRVDHFRYMDTAQAERAESVIDGIFVSHDRGCRVRAKSGPSL